MKNLLKNAKPLLRLSAGDGWECDIIGEKAAFNAAKKVADRISCEVHHLSRLEFNSQTIHCIDGVKHDTLMFASQMFGSDMLVMFINKGNSITPVALTRDDDLDNITIAKSYENDTILDEKLSTYQIRCIFSQMVKCPERYKTINFDKYLSKYKRGEPLEVFVD